MTQGRARTQGEEFRPPSILPDLRSVLDVIPDLVLVLDTAGRVLDWNKPVLIATGITAEDLLYKPLPLLVTEEDRAGVGRAVQAAAAEGMARVEAQLLGSAGRLYDWMLSCIAPVAGAGQVLLAVGRDRTSERQAAFLLDLAAQVCRFGDSRASLEEKLAQFAVGLSPLFDRALCSVLLVEPDGAHFRHVATAGLPAGYLAVAERIPVGVVMGSAAPEAHREETVIVRDLTTEPLWAPYREAALRHGLRAGWFMPIRSASGGLLGALAVYDRQIRRPSAADRSVAGQVAILIQMAIERMQTEERLRQSEERFRALYDEHPCLYLTVAEDGTIVSANQFGAGQFGFSVEELVGRQVADLFHPEDRAALSQGLADCFAHPGFICKWEFRQHGKDGRLRWVRVSTSVRRSPDGHPRALLVCENITAQKRQEDELIDAKNRFESFMRHLPGVAFMKDEEGRHIFANGEFERVFGLRPDEWYGKSVADLFPDDVAKRLDEHDRAVRASGEPYIGSETTRWKGEEQEWLVVKFPIRDSSGRYLLGGIALDMTEHRQAERRLRESHALLSAVMAATADAVYLKDAEGTYLLVNDAYGRMIGKSISEIIGRRAADLFPAAMAEQVGAHDRLVMEQGCSLTFEQILEVNGATRVLLTTKSPFRDGKGQIAGVVGISRDITERMQAEERLRQSEARFRSLIQHATDVTMVLDRDGVVRYESPAFYRIFGYTSGEIVGRSLFELIHPEDLPHAKAAFSVAVYHPGAAAPVEFRIRKADGAYLMVEAVGNNLLDDPSVCGIVLNSRDVTERHRLAEQLRQAQKMEAIGRLAGGIAHDFNNILTVISGYSEVILRRAELVDALRKPVEEIRKAASRASTLTSQLLSFSRQQVLQRQVLNLNEVIANALDMLQRLVGAQVRFVTELDPHLRPISADPTQIEQVLMNLAINARDAMPDGGTVWIETRNITQVPPAVRLTVRDNGKGMDAETLSRAFEPFFTTKARGQGTGLGLAMVYGIIAQHGGTVTADSIPGRGTIFVIDLPCAREGAAPIESAPVPTPHSPATATVLVVDDEDAVREFVCDALRGEGYRVLAARNGDEALERFGTSAEPIDILVADMIMPGINGRQLGERFREARPGLKVVLMSGYTDDGPLHKGEGRDATFLQKPFKIDALFRVLRQELLHRDAGDA